MFTYISIYSLLTIGLAFSLKKSPLKTKKSMMVAFKVFKKTAPSLLAIVLLIGLIIGFLPPETISTYVGEEAGWSAPLIAGLFGAVTLIPAIIAFPLAGSLLRSGASVMTISMFVTSLVMIGTVTAPVEIKTLGKSFTLLRNGLAIAMAILIALIMGVVL